MLEKHGSTDIDLHFPNLERSPPLKTGLNIAVFKPSGKIIFSSDKSNVNFKEPYNSTKKFLATSNIVSGCVSTHF